MNAIAKERDHKPTTIDHVTNNNQKKDRDKKPTITDENKPY